VIKIEKLQIPNMTRSAKGTVAQPGTNVQAKSRLNRSILDQGWGMFARVLNYKLAERGGELVYVDPPAPRRRVPNAVSSTRPAGATKRSSYAPIAATKTAPTSTARVIFIRPGHWPVSLPSEPYGGSARGSTRRRDKFPKTGSPSLQAGEHVTQCCSSVTWSAQITWPPNERLRCRTVNNKTNLKTRGKVGGWDVRDTLRQDSGGSRGDRNRRRRSTAQRGP
jgi:hypothetical protein